VICLVVAIYLFKRITAAIGRRFRRNAITA
jgi:hypothetical protein